MTLVASRSVPSARTKRAWHKTVVFDALDSETGEETTYFGYVEDIWELDYGTFQILVFRCQWVEGKHVTVDNYGVRVLDLSKVGYKDDLWIMANHAA